MRNDFLYPISLSHIHRRSEEFKYFYMWISHNIGIWTEKWIYDDTDPLGIRLQTKEDAMRVWLTWG